jgi:hypothetical protein
MDLQNENRAESNKSAAGRPAAMKRKAGPSTFPPSPVAPRIIIQIPLS